MMKDVIDVLQLQKEKSKKCSAVNYQEKTGHFYAARFIFECGIKLECAPLTIATACTLYHKFFQQAEISNYDCYLIGASSLHVAAKIKDEPLKIRDIINVANNTIHRGSPPVELTDDYWSKRDSIIQAELLIMRMLKFDVNIEHPHKYMFHYLKTLQCWMTNDEWRQAPIAKASLAFLQDYHLDPSVVNYTPQQVAVAAINLALQVYGITIPLTDESDANLWHNVFVPDLPKEKVWEIMEKMMETYDRDSESQVLE